MGLQDLEACVEFQIRVEQIQRRVPIAVFHLSGSLNLDSAAAFEQAGQQTVRQGTHYVLLDLKDVPAVRSAGLRSVQVLYKLLNPKGAAAPPAPAPTDEPQESPYLKLVYLAPEVYYVFEVAGFLRFLRCYNDMETALNSFG